jgi:hypothetical protein
VSFFQFPAEPVEEDEVEEERKPKLPKEQETGDQPP